MISIVTLLMPCHRLIEDISTITWDQNQLLSFKINLANFIQTQFIHLWSICFHWRYTSVIQGFSSSISRKKFEIWIIQPSTIAVDLIAIQSSITFFKHNRLLISYNFWQNTDHFEMLNQHFLYLIKTKYSKVIVKLWNNVAWVTLLLKASENVESPIYQYLYTHTGSLSLAEITHFTFWQILSKVSKIPKLYIPCTINTFRQIWFLADLVGHEVILHS